jgi:hypothetical protein
MRHTPRQWRYRLKDRVTSDQAVVRRSAIVVEVSVVSLYVRRQHVFCDQACKYNKTYSYTVGRLGSDEPKLKTHHGHILN